MKRVVLFATAALAALALVGAAGGAAPDGAAGPWADFVVASNQGPTGPRRFPRGRQRPGERRRAGGIAAGQRRPDSREHVLQPGVRRLHHARVRQPDLQQAGRRPRHRRDRDHARRRTRPRRSTSTSAATGLTFVLAGQISKDGSGLHARRRDVGALRRSWSTSAIPALYHWRSTRMPDGFDVDGVGATRHHELRAARRRGLHARLLEAGAPLRLLAVGDQAHRSLRTDVPRQH